MRFEFVRDPSIPVGAWCLEARRRSDVVRVCHGTLVERIGDDGFCFGAWPGDFSAESLFESTDRAGSGAVIRDGQLVLLAPTNPATWLNLSRVGDDRVVASNSFAYLLRATGATPRPYISSYHSDINHAIFRPDREFDIKLAGPSARPLMLDVYRVDADLTVHRERRASAVRFDDFASYRDKMVGVLSGLASNATSLDRTNPLGLVATISSGYDSGGSLALASNAGWREAVTLVDEQRTDAGTPIGNHLGVHVDEVSLDAWEPGDPMKEAPFFTVSGPEARLRFLGLESHVRQTLMITGGYGDASWEANVDDVGNRFAQTGSSATGERSMAEWLLHVGAVGLPVPAIGADDIDQFERLSNGDEMRQWRGPKGYDRPIPRRLTSERGVPQEMFSTTKIASAWRRAPGGMSAAAQEDFASWLDEHPLPLRKGLDRVLSAPTAQALKVSYYYTREGNITRRLRHLRKLHPPWPNGRLFHWAHDRTRVFYPSAPFG